MGDYEIFTFPGSNGATVEAIFVKPVNFQPGKKYPVAYLLHGGPESAFRNNFSWRWNFQVYAGAGFGIIGVNFHGSDGYGQAFTDSILQHWGDAPLGDLKLGWEAALKRYPFLDASRAALLGASYGGYLAYWLAGVWNEPWKCIVAHDGVFDTRAMGLSTDEMWFEDAEFGGTSFAHLENFDKFNPMLHAASWRVPMLVIQGGKDYRIPEDQAIGAFTALQSLNIPSRFLYLPTEGHWVAKPQEYVQWQTVILDWIEKWTPETAAPERKQTSTEGSPQ